MGKELEAAERNLLVKIKTFLASPLIGIQFVSVKNYGRMFKMDCFINVI